MPPQDNNLVLKRPDWFKWFGKDYMNAVAHWEADQRGWYHHLLNWAAVQGEPPGYLPEDEGELKTIAGFNGNTFYRIASELSRSADGKLVLELYAREQERKWLAVMRKFKSSTDYPGLIYNKMMVNIMEDTMREQYFRSQGGLKAATQRRQMQSLLSLEGSGQPSTDGATEVSSESAGQPSIITSTSKSSSLVTSSKGTLFNPSKFEITNQMRDWLKLRHPDLEEEDYQYLKEQFSNAREKQYAKSWRASFYTYVNNAVKGPDRWYTPFSKREESGGKSNGKYESAAERNARIERENEEHIAGLRSSGSRDPDKDPKALQLPSDASWKTSS